MDRIPLCCLPTPLHRLERLDLGVELWIKRDDLTGFALGGNKGRKLEFLAQEWLNASPSAIVTCGASDSNFIRQLAVLGRMLGIAVHAAVMDLPYDECAGRPARVSNLHQGGNERLSRESGATLHKFSDDDWEVLYDHMHRIAKDLGPNAAIVPIGGSSPLGVYAFVQAAKEVGGEFDTIVCASSSGSTQVGLTTAFRGTSTKVVGIAADPEPALVEDFADLSRQYTGRFGGKPLAPEDFTLDLRFVGPGYGVPSDAGQNAQAVLLRSEGIYLDPIYSAKAFAGLLKLTEEERLGNKVLFWHTGGLPSLFSEYD